LSRRRSASAAGAPKKEAVTEALREYVAHRRQLEVISLFGAIDYDPKFAHKKQRRRL
jgi:hypothetical protein